MWTGNRRCNRPTSQSPPSICRPGGSRLRGKSERKHNHPHHRLFLLLLLLLLHHSNKTCPSALHRDLRPLPLHLLMATNRHRRSLFLSSVCLSLLGGARPIMSRMPRRRLHTPSPLLPPSSSCLAATRRNRSFPCLQRLPPPPPLLPTASMPSPPPLVPRLVPSQHLPTWNLLVAWATLPMLRCRGVIRKHRARVSCLLRRRPLRIARLPGPPLGLPPSLVPHCPATNPTIPSPRLALRPLLLHLEPSIYEKGRPP